MNKIIIFSDGSSRGNPGPGGFGVILYWEYGRVLELGGREDNTTNNRMEIFGAISALEKTEKDGVINFHTDSQYLINGITKWIFSWKKNNWKKADKDDVLNKDLWERLHDLSSERKISWFYAEGHSGIPGNERCDEIATSFADKTDVKLFDGNVSDYKINLSITERSGGNMCSPKKGKTKAYSYLSLVDGKLEKHFSWADCEKKVKGVKSARFKKAKDKEDEDKIIKEWGL